MTHSATVLFRSPDLRRPATSSRRGITIVEMLIAMTISLIVVYALLREFNVIVTQVAEGRSTVELSGQLRGTTQILQADLRGVTAPARPWASPEWGQGYFEYGEGLGYDTGPLSTFVGGTWTEPIVANTAFGDFDDYVAYTAQSFQTPFVGQYGGTTIDAHHAEVVWWTTWNDNDGDGQPNPGEVTLYRRALLVRPDLGHVFSYTTSNLLDMWDQLKTFYDSSDISTHPVVTFPSGAMRIDLYANSLEDLTKRENRFCHHPVLALDRSSNAVVAYTPKYPFDMQRTDVGLNIAALPALNTIPQIGVQAGEDVMQANLLAFDIKAYDPHAPLLASPAGGDILSPNDPGFGRPGPNGLAETAVSVGSFVDLFYMRYTLPRMSGGYPLWSTLPATSVYRVGPTGEFASKFSGPPSFYDLDGDDFWDTNEPFRGAQFPVYDTWSFHYEQDGIDQDLPANRIDGANVPSIPTMAWRGTLDQGKDGVDNDGVHGVDNPAERETYVPYSEALRGLKITIRVIEPDSRNVRQSSVIQDFTPE